ncbi:hypothetical protein [Aureimonas glaciei]|uniref:Uncharacterized protein n=1 Tax=Aureimonas glaciei TaxID=1776957 RepID=A0A916Y4A2_9HYPH|nr:hypothetical protein [Aureimonas glaciei]GGD30658.1 hypothetical protein GCM10011335_37150 [Aureimonas glaciei]
MANELRNLARNIYGVDNPGAAVRPDKRRITDELMGSVDSAFVAVDERIDTEVAALESSIEGAALGLIQQGTWPQLQAIDGGTTGRPGQVTIGGGTHVESSSGLTVQDKGAYYWIVGYGWYRHGDIIDAVSLKASATEAVSTDQRLAVNLGEGAIEAVATRTILNVSPAETTGFSGWGIFDQPTASTWADGFAIYSDDVRDVDHFDVLVVERPGGDNSSAVPGAGANDVIIAGLDPVTTVRNTMATGAAASRLEKELSKIDVHFSRRMNMTAGVKYAFMIRARSAGNGYVQIGRGVSNVTGLPAWAVGFAYNSAGALLALGGVIAAAGYVYRRQPKAVFPKSRPQYTGLPSWGGLTLDLSDVMRRDAGGTRPVFSADGLLSFDAASTGAASQTGFPLVPYSVQTGLPHSNVTVTSVVRESNGAVLTPNIDYRWSPSGGIYGMVVDGPTFNVTVNYTWKNERYDLVVEIPEISAAAVIKGTQRAHTAHEDPYRPVAINQQRPLYIVRVIGDAIADVIPVSDWVGLSSVYNDENVQWWRDYNRRIMARFRGKLMRGEPIIIAVYGDSTTQWGGGAYVDPDSFEPNRSNAFGATDVAVNSGGPFYDQTSEADFNALIAASAGTVTMNGAVRRKLAPHWYVVRELERSWGYSFVADVNPVGRQVTLLNFGIGGTTTATTAGNMGDPARLAVLIDPGDYGFNKPDLVLFHPGMNGTPNNNYMVEVKNILAALRAQDIDVFVAGHYRTNYESTGATSRFTDEGWMEIHSQTRDAAIAVGTVGYAPVDHYFGPGGHGFLGMPVNALCRANYYNHPGPREARLMGEVIAQFFTP